MHGLFETVERWNSEGRRVAIATVVNTWRSSPRPVGSVMVVDDDGQSWGSVSGGCVEGAVIEAAAEVIKGRQSVALEFGGIEPEQLWEIGLSCGGRIRVFVEPSPLESDAGLWNRAAALSSTRKGYVWAVSTSDQDARHALFSPGEHSDHPWAQQARAAYEKGTSCEAEVGDETVFFDVRRPVDRLVIVGGVHIAIPLVKFAKDCGFETVVIEPRAAFAALDRFPAPPDVIIQEWPNTALESLELSDDNYAVVLTHDPKIDDQALRLLMRSPVRYIGALGSRTTQEQRRKTFAEEGFTESELARIHGPVGLDIGALTPEEIALSIIAEVVQVKRGRSG